MSELFCKIEPKTNFKRKTSCGVYSIFRPSMSPPLLRLSFLIHRKCFSSYKASHVFTFGLRNYILLSVWKEFSLIISCKYLLLVYKELIELCVFTIILATFLRSFTNFKTASLGYLWRMSLLEYHRAGDVLLVGSDDIISAIFPKPGLASTKFISRSKRKLINTSPGRSA